LRSAGRFTRQRSLVQPGRRHARWPAPAGRPSAPRQPRSGALRGDCRATFR